MTCTGLKMRYFYKFFLPKISLEQLSKSAALLSVELAKLTTWPRMVTSLMQPIKFSVEAKTFLGVLNPLGNPP